MLKILQKKCAEKRSGAAWSVRDLKKIKRRARDVLELPQVNGIIKEADNVCHVLSEIQGKSAETTLVPQGKNISGFSKVDIKHIFAYVFMRKTHF